MAHVRVTVPDNLKHAVTLHINPVGSAAPNQDDAETNAISSLKNALVKKLDENEKSRKKGTPIPMVM